jgi:hypothetical protein
MRLPEYASCILGKAKDIILRPITRQEADVIIKRVHYSGKVVQNSRIHIGVFYQGKLEGAMQFGPSTDIRRTSALVSGTGWNDFIELNRMAFSDALPRNSESRAIGIAMRMLHQHAPQLQWVISFADGTQCGDGVIYRAAGFVLTSIKKNNQILQYPDGRITNKKTLDNPNHMAPNGRFGSALAREQGARPIPGYQLRYIYFLDSTARQRLTVPELSYSEIEKRNAHMYKGIPYSRAASIDSDAAGHQPAEGGASPTAALQ